MRKPPRYWSSSSRSVTITPAPFLSTRGNPLFVFRHSSGSLERLIEVTRLRVVRWDDLLRSDPIGSQKVARTKDARAWLCREQYRVTGGLFERGVHLAPWTGQRDGRAFVAIDHQHRLVAQSDAWKGEDEEAVRQLLAVALDIADPPDTADPPASEVRHA